MIKRLAASAVDSGLFSAFVTLLERLEPQRPNLLRVLTYHRVDEPTAHPNLSPALISATPTAFERQMQYLADHYHVVSMAELFDVYQKSSVLPTRSVMITVDDAYGDFAENAFPILQRYHLPVTLFVPTSFPNHPERTFWWDRLNQAIRTTALEQLVTPVGTLSLKTPADRKQSFKTLRNYVKSLRHQEAMTWVDQTAAELGTTAAEHHVLTWDKLRDLAKAGVSMGAHTQTHPLMNRISLEEMRAEAAGSLADLQREIGTVYPTFAYPSGGFNDDAVQVLKELGYKLAFTTVRGHNDLPDADPLRMRRINVGGLTNLAVMRMQMLPVMRHINRWQSIAGTS